MKRRNFFRLFVCGSSPFHFDFLLLLRKCFVIIIKILFPPPSVLKNSQRTSLLLLWDVTRFIFWNKFSEAQHYTSKRNALKFILFSLTTTTWLYHHHHYWATFLSEWHAVGIVTKENGLKEMRKNVEKQKVRKLSDISWVFGFIEKSE